MAKIFEFFRMAFENEGNDMRASAASQQEESASDDQIARWMTLAEIALKSDRERSVA